MYVCVAINGFVSCFLLRDFLCFPISWFTNKKTRHNTTQHNTIRYELCFQFITRLITSIIVCISSICLCCSACVCVCGWVFLCAYVCKFNLKSICVSCIHCLFNLKIELRVKLLLLLEFLYFGPQTHVPIIRKYST